MPQVLAALRLSRNALESRSLGMTPAPEGRGSGTLQITDSEVPSVVEGRFLCPDFFFFLFGN